MNQISINLHKAALDDNYILLLTSNEKEKKAVNELIENTCSANLESPNRGCYVGKIGEVFVIHISGTSGISQKDSISRIAASFLEKADHPKPKLTALVGFCWGDPQKVKIGQTLICTTIHSINRNISTPERIEYRSTIFNSPLSVCIESLHEAIGSSSTFKFSSMVSLETLLTSTAERDNIIDQFPTVDGGEMEAFGLIPSITGMPWLIVKTVSDYGCDSFERDMQSATAEISANLTPKIITAICNTNNFSFSQTSSECLALLDAMLGNTITFHLSDFNSDNLNDILNNKYGPIIHHKLSSYCSESEYDTEFPYIMCDLLLELVQNAFRHNGSEKLTLTLNQTSITLSGNNNAYDIAQIPGNKGGAQAWEIFNKNYIFPGNASYEVKNKNHKFSLSRIDTRLRETKKNCTATIKSSTIGSSFYSESGVLVFDTSCDSIYVDSSRVYMRSRALSIVADIQKWLSKGIVIYLSCRTAEEARRYKEYIADNKGLLRVFVG